MHIKGKNNKKKVELYTLTTCVWCGKMKKLLKDLDVDYTLEEVDMLDGIEEKNAVDRITKMTGEELYPTIIIDGKKAISGFEPDKVKKALGL